MLEAAAEINPSYEDVVASLASMVRFDLAMFGEPDEIGFMPMVMVYAAAEPASASMQQIVDANVSQLLDTTTCTVESVGDDRAYIVARGPMWEGSTITQFSHSVMVRADAYVYVVTYTASDSSIEAMEPVFRQSVQTILVKEP